MNTYEAVKFRYSNKKFKNEKIEEVELNKIRNYIDDFYTLTRDFVYNIDFIDATSSVNYLMRNMLINAPYYLCISTKKDAKSLINAGYVFENIALYLTSKGYASCIMNPYRIKLMEKDGLPPVLMMAFGKAKGIPYRDSRYAKRYSTEKIVDGYDSNKDTAILREIVESGILAPSRHNDQPWRFRILDNRIDIYVVNSKNVKRSNYNYISVGCVIANFCAVSEGKWADMHIEKLSNVDLTFDNANYICSYVNGKGKNVL